MELKNKKIFFIGIGGVSMSTLAKFAKELGADVCGSDAIFSPKLLELERLNIKTFVGHKKENLSKETQLVVYSSAILAENEELVFAKSLGIKTISRAKFLSIICDKFETVIAVAGSHGKTTTVAMIATIFKNWGLKFTLHIGGDVKCDELNLGVGGNIFLTEACEYEKNFLQLKPTHSIITNIDYDHVDTYKNSYEYKNAFCEFISRTSKLVVMEKGQVNNIKNAKCNTKILKITKKHVKNVKMYKNACYQFDFALDNKWYNFKLGVPGKFNVFNASKAILFAYNFGVPVKTIQKSLIEFCGVSRRFESKGLFCGAEIFLDYAHHPTEIYENIKLAKTIAKGKVFVVFEPHTFSRTKSFWNEFVDAFCFADQVFIYPIYPAREKPICGVTSKSLAKDLHDSGIKSLFVSSFEDIKNNLTGVVKNGDILLILGAGKIDVLANFLCNYNR